MPQITITQDEVNNHSNLPAMLTNPQPMELNGISCVYTGISQNDFDNNSGDWDADAFSETVLPKFVVEG